MPVYASDDPLEVKDFAQFGAAEPENMGFPAEVPQPTEMMTPEILDDLPAAEPVESVQPPVTEPDEEPEKEETIPETTEPQEAAAEETMPEETMPEETMPEETAPEETVPEETAPEETVPEETTDVLPEKAFPHYFQTDYPDVRFGSGTIANNGCSVTSLAMVATYMTGHEYTPVELARYFGGRAENNIARLEMGSDALRLPYHKAADWNEVYAALQNGKIIILLVDSNSAFTQSQHFIVLTGINEAGRILVYDSYAPNYEKWDLKQGFAEGFDPSAILQGYSGGWIYDPDALPEEPFIYYEPEPVRGESRYPDIQLTLEQEDLLAKVVWVEARGECEAGQQAVAEIVLNRLVSDRFPDNLHDVIYGEGQFRSAAFLEEAQPHQAQYEAIENAIYGPYVLPEDVYYFATTPTTEKVWGVIGGHVFCYAESE